MSTKGASAVQRVDWSTVNLLRPFFDKGPDPVGPRLLDFPMLRGAWVASVDSAGDWYDVSGHGHTLTYNGNPTFNYDGLVSYWDLDGVGDYFSRPDEADLDILGTETYVAAAVQGLTAGGWFWIDTFGVDRPLMSKFNVAGNQRSWALVYNSVTVSYESIISGNGIATVTATSSVTPATGLWIYTVLRFVPSSEVAIFINGTKSTQATIIAALFNSNAALLVGASSAAAVVLDGRASRCFLCAAALSDTQINVFYHMTKRYFGH